MPSTPLSRNRPLKGLPTYGRINNTSLGNVLSLATGLTATPAGQTITNTFAVSMNYRSMYAQTWDLSIYSSLPGGLSGDLTYTGTKGIRLDTEMVPNQAPSGSPLTAEQRRAIHNAAGFLYHTSEGNSVYHAGQVRLTRPFSRGFSANLLYTYSKSIDNSSTLAGSGNGVAQNFRDLRADRGLSGSDRRHALCADVLWPSPGPGSLPAMRWVAVFLGGWTVSGNTLLQSGAPLTAFVLGNQSDSAGTGIIGSARASATGLPIRAGAGFFNVRAFTTPAPGQYGNAGRNTIPGPGWFSMTFSLQRTFSVGEHKQLQVRITSTNVTNHVNIRRGYPNLQ